MGKLILWLLAIAAVVLASWSLFAKDEKPPRLSAEWSFVEQKLAEAAHYELPSEGLLELKLNSNEPVQVSLRYADVTHAWQGRWQTVRIPVRTGTHTLSLEARDRAGNSSQLEQVIVGIPPLNPLVKFPEAIQPGQAFIIQLNTPAQLYGIQLPDSLEAQLNGQPLSFFQAGESLIALAALPLMKEERLPLPDAHITLNIRDRFGRVSQLSQDIIVVPNNIRLETLSLSQDLMNIRSEDNLFYESELLEQAYARVNLPAPLWREPFIQPVQGIKSSGYGIPRRYGVGGNVAFHQGTDMAAAVGTPIVATNDGVVLIAAHDYPIRGNFTMIAHGAEVYSLYFHQSSIDVREGQRVARGDVIGTVGNTGLSTGPHLHWEMHVGKVPTKPEPWVDTLLPGLE